MLFSSIRVILDSFYLLISNFENELSIWIWPLAFTLNVILNIFIVKTSLGTGGCDKNGKVTWTSQ